MARLRRTLLWGISSGLLVVLVAGAYFYFIGTRTILEHAEALAYQRLTVSRLADRDAHRFFFATNRVPDQSDGPLETLFSATRDDTLRFGSFDSKIEPTLGLGVLVDADQWFFSEEIRFKGVRLSSKQEVVEELRAQVEASPRRS